MRRRSEDGRRKGRGFEERERERGDACDWVEKRRRRGLRNCERRKRSVEERERT